MPTNNPKELREEFKKEFCYESKEEDGYDWLMKDAGSLIDGEKVADWWIQKLDQRTEEIFQDINSVLAIEGTILSFSEIKAWEELRAKYLGKIMDTEELLPRECEDCNMVIYYRKKGRNNKYVNWAVGAVQTGESKKYPREFAGYCISHSSNH